MDAIAAQGCVAVAAVEGVAVEAVEGAVAAVEGAVVGYVVVADCYAAEPFDLAAWQDVVEELAGD